MKWFANSVEGNCWRRSMRNLEARDEFLKHETRSGTKRVFITRSRRPNSQNACATENGVQSLLIINACVVYFLLAAT
jgi:hypothetical protein